MRRRSTRSARGPSGGSAFISPDLGAAATATKSGYTVGMTGTPATGTAPATARRPLASGYHAWADPVSTSTGTRYFGTNTTGTIWQSTASLSRMTDAATPASPAAAIQ
jgi:hypothetical protein